MVLIIKTKSNLNINKIFKNVGVRRAIVTYFPTNLVFPLTLRVTGIIIAGVLVVVYLLKK